MINNLPDSLVEAAYRILAKSRLLEMAINRTKLEEKHPYQEGHDSTAGSEGKLYQLDTLFKSIQNRTPSTIKVSDLNWVLNHTDVQESRVDSADIRVPLLVYKSSSTGDYVTLDGAHRLTKAVREGVEHVPIHLLSHDDLKKAEIHSHK